VNTRALTRAGLVPYITSWSGEPPSRAPVVAKGTRGIAYQHERRNDRDNHGVLWMRCARAPGVGEPEFGMVHPYRQRRAMRQLLCQVCGNPADRNEHGTLWLLGDAEQGWSDTDMTCHPPVCLPCAAIAARTCPHLRRDPLAMRVRHAPISGVFGQLFTPTRRGPIGVGDHTLAYDHPQVGWLHAYQLIRELHDWTAVDLDQELAASGLQDGNSRTSPRPVSPSAREV
jgi:hypothetical protein